MSAPIPVRPVEHPTLCFARPHPQPGTVPKPGIMDHCTKPQGHADAGDAKHSWERD